MRCVRVAGLASGRVAANEGTYYGNHSSGGKNYGMYVVFEDDHVRNVVNKKQDHTHEANEPNNSSNGMFVHIYIHSKAVKRQSLSNMVSRIAIFKPCRAED